MIDFMNGNLVAHQLHLHAFTTINKKMFILNVQILRGRKSPVCRNGPARAQYGKLKTHVHFSNLNLIKKPDYLRLSL